MQIGGGLGEEYMHAPALQVGGGKGGGGSFIASLLDLLGIHKQVAKEPKEGKDKEGQGASPAGKVSATGGAPAFTPTMGAPSSPAAAPPSPAISILDDAGSAFRPMTPLANSFGRSFMRAANPFGLIER